MRSLTFEEYWSQNWSELRATSQSAIFDAAMCDIALKAWDAAILSVSTQLVMGDSDIRLMAGELNAGEMRTTKAVLAGCNANVFRLIQAEHS